MKRMVKTYDQVHNNRYWKEIQSAIDPKRLENGVIVDLGCGPGLLLKDLALKYNPRKLVGIDLSDHMLDRAREELQELSPTIDIELVQQHLQEDPTLPNKIDGIFSSRVMRSFKDQETIMRAIHNSLSDNGYFIILDWSRAQLNTYAKWFSRDDNEFNDLSPGEIIRYHQNFSRYDLQDWRFILENFGFTIIHSFQLDAVHCCVIATKPNEE